MPIRFHYLPSGAWAMSAFFHHRSTVTEDGPPLACACWASGLSELSPKGAARGLRKGLAS